MNKPYDDLPLVVTRNGVPCPDQKAALAEFMAQCKRPAHSEMLGRLKTIELYGGKNEALSVAGYRLEFHFVNGGEAINLAPGLSPTQLANELRYIADRIQRRDGV